MNLRVLLGSHLKHFILALGVAAILTPIAERIERAAVIWIHTFFFRVSAGIGECDNAQTCNDCVATCREIECYFIFFGDNQASCVNGFGLTYGNRDLKYIISTENETPDLCFAAQSYFQTWNTTTIQPYIGSHYYSTWNAELYRFLQFFCCIFVLLEGFSFWVRIEPRFHAFMESILNRWYSRLRH